MPVGKRFEKGVSGNPGGRPKGVTASIKALCGDSGEKLHDLLWLYANGTDKEIKQKFKCKWGPRHEVRLQAIAELLDRGYGKPIQAVTVGDPDGNPMVFTLKLGNALPGHGDSSRG